MKFLSRGDAGVCRKSQESMKKLSQRRGDAEVYRKSRELMKKLSRRRGDAEVYRKSRESMKKFSQRHGDTEVYRKSKELKKKLSQRRGDAEIAELLFAISVLNSGKHQNIFWIKRIFLIKRIPLRSLRLCVSAKILHQYSHQTFPTVSRGSARVFEYYTGVKSE